MLTYHRLADAGGLGPPIPCNAYCRAGLHAHIVWLHREIAGTDLIASAVGLLNPGLTVLDVRAAPEAAPSPSVEDDFSQPYLVLCRHAPGVQEGVGVPPEIRRALLQQAGVAVPPAVRRALRQSCC